MRYIKIIIHRKELKLLIMLLVSIKEVVILFHRILSILSIIYT